MQKNESWLAMNANMEHLEPDPIMVSIANERTIGNCFSSLAIVE